MMIDQIPIDAITVGVRRRQKLGNLQGLAHSIEARGLLHPIIIRGNQLVAGQRRLEACKRLGWTKIPARRIETMTDDESRAAELEENTERLALADFESSQSRLAQIRQAEAVLKAKETCLDQKQVSRKKGKRGPARTPGSKRDVAEATGISPAAQVQIERHVTLAEQYPFVKRNGWVMHQALEAGSILEKIPLEERDKIAALLDQDAIPPKKSIEIIENMAQMPASARKEIFKLAEFNILLNHFRDRFGNAIPNFRI